MRGMPAPPETFSHSPPISRRTRCHDDPSGARVAILITVGPAYAAARKETRNSRTAVPAAPAFPRALEVPFRPGQGPPHRLGAPPFERDEVFVDRPVVVILLQRKGAAHEGFAPGKVREQGRIGPREGDRKAPGGGGPEKQGAG